MRKFSSPDQLLWRYDELTRQLEAPKASSGVLHSGWVYARQCEARQRGGDRCPSTEWVPKGEGQGQHRVYYPVCRRCGKPWAVFLSDVRKTHVQASVESAQVSRYHELGTIITILKRLPLWQKRVWWLWVIRPTGPLDLDGLADLAARTWKRKHVSEPGGFFTKRHCRTLVAEARAAAEKALRRAGLWEPSEPR